MFGNIAMHKKILHSQIYIVNHGLLTKNKKNKKDVAEIIKLTNQHQHLQPNAERVSIWILNEGMNRTLQTPFIPHSML